MAKNKVFAYAQKSEILDDEKSIVCYASTNEVDRHGEMILASAWTDDGLKNYRKNPVILVNHDYWSLPVAKSIWQKTDSNGLKFKIRFADTEAGNEIYSLYKGGYMSSFSVGFRPVRTYDNTSSKKYKDKNGEIPHTVYEECELLELSCVTIPANPSATMIGEVKSLVELSNSGGIKCAEVKSMIEKVKGSKEYIELVSEQSEEKAKIVGHIDLVAKLEDCGAKQDTKPVEKVETTEKYHHIPVRDVGDFVEDSFRTIDITDGVKAVIGKLKSDPEGSTHIQKYLFDVDSFTMEEAQQWVSEHKDTEKAQEPMDEDKPMKPCKVEGGKCPGEACEEYGDCDEEIKKSFEEKGVGSSMLPISDKEDWDGNMAMMHMREYAGGEDNMDWEKYSQGFAYFDAENKEEFGSYKLPFADVIDRELTATWGGVKTAMAALHGSRSPMRISEEDKKRAHNLLAKYYKKFDKEVPEMRSYVSVSIPDEQISRLTDEIKRYVDEKIEKTLKFSGENADKVNIRQKDQTKSFEEQAKEFLSLFKSERKDSQIVDISPDVMKNMVRDAVSTAIKETQTIDKLVEERLMRAKGKIF